MLTFIIFVIVLSILVFVHELGHFVMAKRSGMKVEEFGFGFPPRLFGIKRGETIYSINLIPFGGFVKILGEDGNERENPRSFTSKSLGIRAGVIVAGVVMNFLLAVFLLVIVNSIGLRVGLVGGEADAQAVDRKVQVIQVAADSPAEEAGLKILDEILSLKSGNQEQAVSQISDVQQFVDRNRTKTITITVGNGDQVRTVDITPRDNPPAGQGALGIAMAVTGIVKYPWYQAIAKGLQYAAILFVHTLIGYAMVIKNILTHGTPGVEISGPVGIATVTGQAARFGFVYLMQFMALISVNLAVLNIIPFPALDGGRLLFIMLEKIKGRPLSKKFEMITNTAGFALLLALMVYITTKDITRLF